MFHRDEDSARLLGRATTSPPSASTTEMTTFNPQRIFFKDGNLDISVGCSARDILLGLQADPSLASDVRNVVVQHNGRANVAPSIAELTTLFAEVGRSCPRLESLRVALDITGNRDGPAIDLPVAALTSFFEQGPKHLVSLKLSAVISAEKDQDFQDLEAAICAKAPQSWKEVRLEFCEPSPGTPSLDPLLQAMSRSGNLEQVTLSGTNMTHSSICTGPSLVKLVTENDLKVLTVWGGKRLLKKKDTLPLVQALERNTNLKELTLHARGLCPTTGQALARSLAANTTLERLVLCVSDSSPSASHSSSDYVTTTSLLADALRLHNRTLRLLSLDYASEDEDILMLGDSLDYDFYEYELINTRAAQWRSNIHQVTKAFTQMLHSNPVLEVLWMNLDYEEEEDDEAEEHSQGLLTPEMDMLLRLNRYGIRRGLFDSLSEATSQEWMKALASQKDDLHALYYLLSKNPSLCGSASPHRTKRGASPALFQESKRRKTSH